MDEHWISITRLGSSFEEEVDINSRPAHFRHRKIRSWPLPWTRFDGSNEMEDEHTWEPGRAPDS